MFLAVKIRPRANLDASFSNRTARCAPGIPIFLAQGTNDQIIRPAVAQAYLDKLWQGGSKVRMVILPDIGHGHAAQASTMAAVNWLTDRFAGSVR
ncbi:lipase family protein [Bradyrhizobium sp. SRL28]|uniref:lipase family protein n=1 Tax=Bradyrhizobium sp. SRL28 TaxID=2836178 RepID=UPI001BDE0A8E|nr:lipase family protein [Bradyrhizobium sp. SRL28]MBT1517345.1 lipase family protein [Bradyrhizobium sp. SRL28]